MGARSRSTYVKSPQKLLEEPVELVAAGYDHSLVMTKKGEIYAWGNDKDPERIIFSENSPVVFLMCGNCHSGVIEPQIFRRISNSGFFLC
jgi:hypothetical protein